MNLNRRDDFSGSLINNLVTNSDFTELEKDLKKKIGTSEKPIDLETFLYSKDYLGLEITLSERQFEVLKAADCIDPSTAQYTEFVLEIGKGGGKDLLVILVFARIVYLLLCEVNPLAKFGLADFDTIDLLNVAISADQARDVFFIRFKNVVKNAGPKAYKQFGFDPIKDILQSKVVFPKSIIAYSGHSKQESQEGKNYFLVVLDECSGFLMHKAQALYDVLRSSINTRFPHVGKLFLISYPRYKNDFVERFYNDAATREHVFRAKGSTWDFNPLRKKEDFLQDYEANYEKAKAMYECISGDSKIFTEEGIKEIKDVAIGEKLSSGDNYERITHKVSKGVRDVFEITTRAGYKIKATKEHPVKAFKGKECIWKEVRDLKVGDKIPIIRAPQKFGKLSKITEEEAEIVGQILGDGCISRWKEHTKLGYSDNVCICYDLKDKDVLLRQFKLLKSFKLFPRKALYKSYGNIYLNRNKDVSFIKNLGISRARAWEKEVPDYIFQSKESIIAKFLSGLFEADGWISNQGCVGLGSSSYKMITQVHMLLLMFGIVAQVRHQKAFDWKLKGTTKIFHSKESWQLRLSRNPARVFSEKIGFISKRKRARCKYFLKRKVSKYHPVNWRILTKYFTDQIVSIKLLKKKEEVFDITVVPSNQFISNGFIVHNCMPDISGEAYIRELDKIEKITQSNLTHPIDETGRFHLWFKRDPYSPKRYYVHVDLALGKTDITGFRKSDVAAVAMGYKEEDMIYIVLQRIYEGAPGKEIEFTKIRDDILHLKRIRDLNIAKVTLDGFQSVSMRQELQAAGISTGLLSVDRKIEPYDTLKSLILQEKIKAYPLKSKPLNNVTEDLLVDELKGLILIDGKKVDHLDTTTKDLADCVCAVAYNCMTLEPQHESSFSWRVTRG